MLQQGIDLQRIDRVFREFGFAAGPLEMIDFIGVDTIMYAGETFLRTLPELIDLTPVLPALVKRDRLGRKVGRGFYHYDSQDGPAIPDHQFDEILKKYLVNEAERVSSEIDDAQILQRLLNPMVAEAGKLLQEGVVDDERDVDLCSILGTTFPKARGGILNWAKSTVGKE